MDTSHRNPPPVTFPTAALTYLHIYRMTYSGDRPGNRSRTVTPVGAPSSSLCRLWKQRAGEDGHPLLVSEPASLCVWMPKQLGSLGSAETARSTPRLGIQPPLPQEALFRIPVCDSDLVLSTYRTRAFQSTRMTQMTHLLPSTSSPSYCPIRNALRERSEHQCLCPTQPGTLGQALYLPTLARDSPFLLLQAVFSWKHWR